MAVKIDGQDTVLQHTRRVEFVESLHQLDLLVLEVELSRQSDTLAIRKLLAPGAPFVVELYDGTALKWSAAGDLMEVTHERRGAGLHRIVALGVDALHKLRGAPVPKLWEASHADIMQQIGQRHGLTVTAEGVSTVVGHELQDETDALFVRRLAREHNYYVRASSRELHFKRWAASGTAIAAVWGDNLLEISTRAALQELVTKVTVNGYDAVQDAAIVGTAVSTDAKKITSSDTGVSIAKAKFGELPLVLNESGYIAATNATNRAKSELQRRAEQYVQGQARLTGTPSARAGQPLTITKAGWPFDGTFLADEVRNVLDAAGHRTLVGFRSDSLPSPP